MDDVITKIQTPIFVPLTGFPASRSKLLDVIYRFNSKKVTLKGEIVGRIASIRVGGGANARAEVRFDKPLDVTGLKLDMLCQLVSC